MTPAPIPEDETQRLEALRSCEILDTKAEDVYDRITAIATEVCRVPIAMFSIVDSDRQWFKSRIGLDIVESPRDVSFCGHAVAANQELLVPDAKTDARFLDNDLVVSSPHIRFYYGIPVHAPNAQPIGTLCVIDRVPRSLEQNQKETLLALAREVEAHIAVRQAHIELNRLLADRELICSTIAHDARNLLVNVAVSIDLLSPLADGKLRGLAQQARYSIGQLSRMLQNLMDVADLTSHQGKGVAANIASINVEEWFNGFVARESGRARRESKELCVKAKFSQPVFATDQVLLDRVTLNLLDNALRATPTGGEVSIEFYLSESHLTLIVEDQGTGIPPELRETVFEPRYSSTPTGNGLGLASCRLATAALCGTIHIEDSESSGARFVVQIPAPTY